MRGVPNMLFVIDTNIESLAIAEAKKLKIPIVIIQGSTDLQVKEEDAVILFKAHPLNSRLIIIENMNHVLKIAPLDRTKNIETYSKPDLPLAEELVKLLGTL